MTKYIRYVNKINDMFQKICMSKQYLKNLYFINNVFIQVIFWNDDMNLCFQIKYFNMYLYFNFEIELVISTMSESKN